MNFSSLKAGLLGLVMATLASVAGAQLFSGDNALGGPGAVLKTFEDFCRLHPTQAEPVGDDPIWVEWLVVDAATLPAKPTSDMVQQGRLARQVTHFNRCTSTEQWQLVDRAPDGRELAAVGRIGSALYTLLLPVSKDRIEVNCFLDHGRLAGWTENNGRPEALISRSSLHTSLTVDASGAWTKIGETGETRTTKEVGKAETTTATKSGFYLRVLTSPPIAP